MISSIFLIIGTSLLFVAMKVLFDESELYFHGVKKIGKIVKLNSYSYVSYSSSGNKYYNYGINPLIEIDIDNRKVLVDYHSYNDMYNLNEGDEIKVVYPESNMNNITIYSKYRIFKNGVGLVIVAITILVSALATIML